MTSALQPGMGRPDLRGQDSPSAGLWRAVDELVDDATVAGILAHKLGPLAAGRWRALGRDVPKALADEERAASFALLSASGLLRRIREVGDGPLILLKGPELALRYPPAGRRFGDIDLLAPDAHALHQALQQHGFEEVPEPDFDHSEHHHLVPLRWPVVPLLVEIHEFPNWPPRLKAPPLAEILEAAGPSATGVDGVSAPHPLHHALILAAHAWRHEPLQTLRDLLDVAAMSVDQDSRELERTADAWNVGRIWRSTKGANDRLFSHGPRTPALRVWGRHLESVRERSGSEVHLQRVLSPWWGLPPRLAALETLEGLKESAAPLSGEGWNGKLRRVARTLRNPGGRRGSRPER